MDHVDGTTWVQRKLNYVDRISKYCDELLAGVKLRCLCRSCNAGHLNNRGRK